MAEKPTDSEILDLFFLRDERALTETQNKYGGYVKSLCAGILGKGGEGEECFNDALLALWNHIPPDRPFCFKAYLTKLTRNLCLMKYREKTTKKRLQSEYALSVEELTSGLTEQVSAEKAFEQEELRRLIDAFVASLPSKRRYVFVARYCMSAPVADIAKELKVSQTTVFNDLSYIKKALTKRLQKEGYLK